MKVLDSDHILAKIVAAKRGRLHKTQLRVPEAIVKRMAATAPPAPSFYDAIDPAAGSPGSVRLIAEIKKASPSKGVLCARLNVDELAVIYKFAGAAAISVVTEEDFFQGDLGWLGKAAKTSGLPVLRKDFVFDPFQIYEARSAGASALLLIAAMLKPDEMKELYTLARETKLDVLVEVHDEAELGEALDCGADIIGVNNRDLKTFKVDLETSFRLAKLIPDDKLFVVESGINSRIDVQRLIDAGADAFLVGEYFVASGDPAAAIRGLL